VDGVEDIAFEGKTATVTVTAAGSDAAVAALEKVGYKPVVK
jgi:hypothetical protein